MYESPIKVDIFPLDLTQGCIARTLVVVHELTKKEQYEVITRDLFAALDDETVEFWEDILKDYPFETTIYRCVSSGHPYSKLERQLAELVPINDLLRRDLELGDVYVSRSKDAEAASIEHQDLVEQFKSNEIVLLTQAERCAIYGPGKAYL